MTMKTYLSRIYVDSLVYKIKRIWRLQAE
jgi:hypothetical protein